MKTKITYPDWTTTAYLAMSRAEDSKRPVWHWYTRDPDDQLILCLTVEITSALCSPDGAACNEGNRRAAWSNALAFAEHLWRGAPCQEYVVMYRPEDPITGHETVCVCRRLNALAESRND